jgi:hypothetical protein
MGRPAIDSVGAADAAYGGTLLVGEGCKRNTRRKDG